MAMSFLTIPIALTILFIIIGCLLIWGIIKFTLYIFQSFGLLNIAKKEKYKFKYLVWIPGISHYFIGKFAAGHKIGIGHAALTTIKLILFICVIFIENNILFYTFLGYLVIYFVIDILIMNQFYQKAYKQAQIFTIITIITLGLLKPIFIYTTRIKKITNDF